MKFYDKKTAPGMLNFGLFAIGTMCGSKVFRRYDWQLYPLFWRKKGLKGFGVGPILFWDGS